MQATLSIIVDLLEPALVSTADELKGLDPSQIRRLEMRLTSDKDGSEDTEPARIDGEVDHRLVSMAELVEFAQATQPNATVVEIWYHGRCESFSF